MLDLLSPLKEIIYYLRDKLPKSWISIIFENTNQKEKCLPLTSAQLI